MILPPNFHNLKSDLRDRFVKDCLPLVEDEEERKLNPFPPQPHAKHFRIYCSDPAALRTHSTPNTYINTKIIFKSKNEHQTKIKKVKNMNTNPQSIKTLHLNSQKSQSGPINETG